MINFGKYSFDKFVNSTATLEDIGTLNKYFNDEITDSETITAISFPKNEPTIAIIAGTKKKQ